MRSQKNIKKHIEMKKQLSFLMMMAAAVGLSAQTQVNNAGFENWTQGRPDGWTTYVSGEVTTTLPIIGEYGYPVSCEFGSQTTDAFSGSYALKLQAASLGIEGIMSYTLPGIAQLGDAGTFSIPLSTIQELLNNPDSLDMEDLMSLSTLRNVVANGMACTRTPVSIKMRIKYLPQNDTLTILSFTTKQDIDTDTDSTDDYDDLEGIVSEAFFQTAQTIPEYTEIEIPFDEPSVECDRIRIVILSGSFGTANAATELYLDDIRLDYGTDVPVQKAGNVRVYPNPARDFIYVESGNGDTFRCRLADLTGRTVAAQENVAGQAALNVKALAPGIYLLKMEQGSQTFTRKVVVR